MRGKNSIRLILFNELISYVQNNINTRSFCDGMYDLFFPDVPIKELSAFEYAVLSKLAYACARFSPYESDIQQCPGAYNSESQIRSLALQSYDELLKHNCFKDYYAENE